MSSFTKAAHRLNVGLPLLSKRIGSLEETLGLRLFHRSTRKVSMTQDVIALFPQIQSLLEDANLDIIDNQLDLAIRVEEPRGADFIYKKLAINKILLCASPPQYLKSANTKFTKLEHLRTHSTLSLSVYRLCRFHSSDFRIGDFFSSRTIICESGLFLTELACRGAGIAVRSEWDVDHLLKQGKLVQVLKEYELDPFGTMYVIIPHRRLLAHRVRDFLDFLEHQIGIQHRHKETSW